jgi:hypothetical protein
MFDVHIVDDSRTCVSDCCLLDNGLPSYAPADLSRVSLRVAGNLHDAYHATHGQHREVASALPGWDSGRASSLRNSDSIFVQFDHMGGQLSEGEVGSCVPPAVDISNGEALLFRLSKNE